MQMQVTERHREYWRRNITLTLALLGVWFVATFVMAYFARPLAEITLFGWPLSFYMGAQGSLIVYVVVIFVYAKRMAQLDREYGVQEEDDR
jgi:putative solute:sodium symporter small subunit